MPTITKLTLTTTMVNIHLSDHTLRGYVYADPVAAFLYMATPAEREAWQIVERGAAVTWPALGRTLRVEQLG